MFNSNASLYFMRASLA